MATVKPLENGKSNQPIYITEVVQVYGPVPIKQKTTFNAADAQQALKKLVDAKKSVKLKVIGEAGTIHLKKKGVFGKALKLKALPYSSVKSFYQFAESPTCMVMGIEGKDIPKQYVVFGMPSVEKVNRLYEVLQMAMWAPKNNLKNKIPPVVVKAEEEEEHTRDTTSSSSSSSSSSRSRSPSHSRTSERRASEDVSRSLSYSEERIHIVSTTHSTRDSPKPPTPVVRTPERRSSTSSSSSSSSYKQRRPASRSMSSTSDARSIPRTPTIQTPERRSSRSSSSSPAPPPQPKPAPPPVKAPSSKPPKTTPPENSTQYVQYHPQNDDKPKPSAKKPVCTQPTYSDSESDSDSEEVYAVKSDKRRKCVPSGGVFLIADRKGSRLRNHSVPSGSTPAEMHRSSSIFLFQGHGSSSSSSSSDSDSSSDDEFEVRKIRTKPRPTIARSDSTSSSSSASVDGEVKQCRKPVIYRVPIRR